MAKKILVIDDEVELLKVVGKRLSGAGYEVITAKDGQEGLEKAKAALPDLILLDILMPKVDGFEVCRLLKFDAKYKFIVVIMLTAKTQEVDKETAKTVGADDYISKPFDHQAMLNKIKKFLGE